MSSARRADPVGSAPIQILQHPPLQGYRLLLLTVALPLATFMQVLDTTIANVAVPTLAGQLGSSSIQGTWVITSYVVASAIVLPITGWLARRFGEVRLFLWSTGLFVCASFLCGMATSLGMLVAFRVLQGAVAGPMLPLAQTLLLNNYPPAKRNMAIALWSMTVSVAPIFGPVVGGWISDNYYWGWIFFINVPVGILVVALVWWLLRGRESAVKRQPLNVVGLALLILGIGALQMMLDRGKGLDWFNSPEIIALAVIAVVALAFLVAWELTDANPIIDLRLFASRNFSIGVICISLGMMLFLGTVVLLPLLLQTQYGYTATLAGLAAAPIGILPILLAPLIGKYALRLIDLRVLISIGFLVFAACMYTRTWFSPDMDMHFVMIPQFAQGLANALFFTPLIALAFSGLKPEKMANAASLFNSVRTLFGAIGTSLAMTLWERREAVHHARLSEHVNEYSPLTRDSLQSLQALGLDASQSAAYLAGEITRQSFILSANDIYWLCAIGFSALIALVWLARPAARG